MRVRGFPRLYFGLVVGRMAGSMLSVTLVLFVLGQFHSPQLAGLTAFLAGFPGLIVSPLAGALLDRRGRARMVVVDFVCAALAAGLTGALAGLNLLPAIALLVIVGVASLTNPLSYAGARALFPLVAPAHLWERANALDSTGYIIANLAAAPTAGVLVSELGGPWALAVTGGVFAAAAIAMAGVAEPVLEAQVGSVTRNAWLGLKYVIQNPSLRGIALTLGIFNLGSGMLTIALPVLVLSRLRMGPATVGALWGVMSAVGLVSALLVGRLKTRGRERRMIVLGVALCALATAVLPFATTLSLTVLAIVLLGISSGPFDIAVFTLRQRRTDPAWFGRVFAVSMSLNTVGVPLGSAMAGPLIGWSLNLALWAAVAVSTLALVFPLVAIPGEEAEAPTR